MKDVTRIKQIKEKVDVWPHKQEHYKVDMLAPNNKIYETTIHKSEFEIWKWYVSHKHYIREDSMRVLLKSINDYGQHKYSEGDFNASENADL